ncbi:spore coat protein U domain-containing protein [Achromobacter ruhlandii]|nr:spore coat protein U domain-containing protein [Achromobacter ruhlandii]MCZ8395794.1 spore coat protein U domain-containing protein [Achromobacter ruhlandii]
MKNTLLNAAMLCGCTFSAASFAADPPAAAPTYSAGEVRGQLAVELTIGKGCEVVNGSVNGANAFGTLSFGEVSSLTNNSIDAQAKGTAGAIVQLNCTKDVSYRVSLDDGRNSSGQGARRLALVGGRQGRLRTVQPVQGRRAPVVVGQQESLYRHWQRHGGRHGGVRPHSDHGEDPRLRKVHGHRHADRQLVTPYQDRTGTGCGFL